MPQKLNKAGQMQDYIPKGNGDASGEYGTSNGTNKNFTTSDKKKTEANVITENKSVVVENKGKKTIPYNEWIKKDGNKERLEKGVEKWVENKGKNKLEPKYSNQLLSIEKYVKEAGLDESYIDKLSKKFSMYGEARDTDELLNVADLDNAVKELKDNKANIIDNDLTGKETPKGKSATRKDEYGNNLVSDEAFIKGYEAGKKYLDGMTKYYDKDKLLMSNVFLGYLTDEISKGINDAGLNEEFDLTYQDFSEIAGALLDRNVNYKEYETNGWRNPSKIYTGPKYTGYKPQGLK